MVFSENWIRWFSCIAGLQQEGLFRKSGHIGRQKVLRELIEASPETGSEVIVTQLNSGNFSPHDVASLLKSFLGDMPQPLLTDRHYSAYCQLPGKARKWEDWGGGSLEASFTLNLQMLININLLLVDLLPCWKIVPNASRSMGQVHTLTTSRQSLDSTCSSRHGLLQTTADSSAVAAAAAWGEPEAPA